MSPGLRDHRAVGGAGGAVGGVGEQVGKRFASSGSNGPDRGGDAGHVRENSLTILIRIPRTLAALEGAGLATT